MFGRKCGLGVLLGKDAPLLTHVHCLAHRLSLACGKGCTIPEVLQRHTQELVHSCQWLWYLCWKVRINAGYNGRTPVEAERPYISVRWLAMENAVTTVHYTMVQMLHIYNPVKGKTLLEM